MPLSLLPVRHEQIRVWIANTASQPHERGGTRRFA
jgi:hypothetical protein